MIHDLDPEKLPKHVAIIMDGNGRWAKKRDLSRVRGHQEGAESVRAVVRAGREIGVRWLTLYAFSEENWKRPKYEIEALMKLLKRFLASELREMLDNGIRLQFIGRVGKLTPELQKALEEAAQKTSHNKDMVLTLALSYGGRQEISDAVAEIARKVQSGEIQSGDVSEELIAGHLYTAQMPDPDLLIRTGGEYRVSNFLLWQLAYTEMYITPVTWPEFRKEEFLKALQEYQKRERRFGAVGED